MKKLSIIVPVYNVEKYIEKCISSLLNQTIENYEIIVIDDGSLDKSIDIVKRFNSPIIKIVSQKNGGLSAARNKGLSVANGEYIAFVDGDDYIGINDAYEEMYNLSKKEGSDMVGGNALIYYSDTKKFPMKRNYELFSKSPMKMEDFYIASLESKRTYAPVWLNIYKREIFFNNNIRFKEGIYHEDEEIMPRILINVKKVSIYSNEFYIYRQREGSITNTSNTKRGMDLLETSCEINAIAEKIKNEKLKMLLKKYSMNIILDQTYEYKIKKISEINLKIVKENSQTLKERLEYILIKINTSLYCKVRQVYKCVIFRFNGERYEK